MNDTQIGVDLAKSVFEVAISHEPGGWTHDVVCHEPSSNVFYRTTSPRRS